MSLQEVTLQLEWPALECLELETITAGALVLRAVFIFVGVEADSRVGASAGMGCTEIRELFAKG